jgi:hypothetical protein
MPLYKLDAAGLRAVDSPSMALLKIRERQDLQRVLRENIQAISPDTLVISEEFTGWIGSLRRIDLLGIDPDGTLVVFELKRTEDGGHMELQSIRYAAMVSVLSFHDVVAVFAAHLARHNRTEDAESLLRDHLETGNDGDVAAKVRIVLASADFGPEITTTVLWLNKQNLDIRCVRMVPYQDGDSVFLDVQQIIPLPEAADYMIKLREKEEERKEADRQGDRDYTRFVVACGGKRTEPLPKRRAMLELIRTLVNAGHSPDDIQVVFLVNRFLVAEGNLQTEAEFAAAAIHSVKDGLPTEFRPARFFTAPDELLHFGDKTYAFSNQWGSKTRAAITRLLDRYPDLGLKLEEVK